MVASARFLRNSRKGGRWQTFKAQLTGLSFRAMLMSDDQFAELLRRRHSKMFYELDQALKVSCTVIDVD